MDERRTLEQQGNDLEGDEACSFPTWTKTSIGEHPKIDGEIASVSRGFDIPNANLRLRLILREMK